MNALAPLAENALAELRALQRDRALVSIDAETIVVLSAAFAAEQRDALRVLRRFRAGFPIAEALTDRQIRELLAALAAAQARRANKLAARLARQLAAAFAAGARTSALRLEIAGHFDVKAPQAVRWLQQHAAQLVSGIDETTRSRTAALVTQAVEEGWSYNKTEARLKELYDGYRATTPYNAPRGIVRYPEHITSRAQLIAVQESAVAYGEGERQTCDWLRKSGIKLQKSWLAVGDERTCEVCEGNAGESWIPYENAFSDGSAWTPGHVACRCCIEYTRVGAELGRAA